MSKVDATCAQPVYDLWATDVQLTAFLHTPFGETYAPWTTTGFTHSLYKFFTQVIPGHFCKFLSVIEALYTFYTWLIKTTANCMKGNI